MQNPIPRQLPAKSSPEKQTNQNLVAGCRQDNVLNRYDLKLRLTEVKQNYLNSKSFKLTTLFFASLFVNSLYIFTKLGITRHKTRSV